VSLFFYVLEIKASFINYFFIFFVNNKMSLCKAKLKTGKYAGDLCQNKSLPKSKFCGVHKKPAKSKRSSRSKRSKRSKRSSRSKRSRRSSRVKRSKRSSRARRILKFKQPKSPKRDGNIFNEYFDKVYIVNLEDKKEAYDEVSEQLNRYGINHDRFLAIDGRGTPEVKEQKRKMFEKEYGLHIGLEKGGKVNMPAISLTIGNILMMREMVKNGWKRMLILEDDVILDENIMKDFEEGVKEIDKAGIDWDLLYLSCGAECGRNGVSYNKTSKNKYRSTWMEHHSWPVDLEEDYGQAYVHHPFDIRLPCSLENCPKVSKHITQLTGNFGGTFAYSISLKGAKKFLKFVNNKIGGKNDKKAHIDQLLKLAVEKGIMSAYAFDPTVMYHKDGMLVAGQRSISW
jgi:GR25 family glycosyltransferase involved in LPS biosynthesis